MIRPRRWPLHPAPVDGEALSSWLRRIAECHGTDLRHLGNDIGHKLDSGIHEGIDLTPPPGLIEALEERTGVAPKRLRQMSVAGWVPWLLDDIEPAPDGFETYARQLSVLCLAGNLKTRIVPLWRPWLTDQMSPRACPECVAAKPSPQPYQLLWEIPIVSSCQAHGCWLEATNAGRGYFDIWDFNRPIPRPAPQQILVLGQRTFDVFILGYVDLPRRKVHAGIWFLRTIIDELGRPFSESRTSGAKTIRRIWKEAAYRCRDGQSLWRPYEQQPEMVQRHTMEAAATAIALLENGSITGRGKSAHLLQPDPPPQYQRRNTARNVEGNHRRAKAADTG